MFWLTVGISALIAALLVNGLIHQERLRLWKLWQQELADQKRLEIEEKKRQAGEKVKHLLRDRRASINAPQDASATQTTMNGTGYTMNDAAAN